MEIDEEIAIAWNNKGYVHTILGQYDEAIVCFDRALYLEPEDETARKNRSIAERRRTSESG
ncbi:tetratricopeptide repeat protein [Methanoculleus sp. FWC-SCC1]|uniref:Tetratricopeptide repeat protein n=1 Tax=Methanoculleus frigidifontis TaxID=2584085 RepID=A0ABT8MDT4_9EURY|nr:tetratricopeptide repeat protein [Methanoculleus sp. FWC-SCC1]